MSRAQLTSTVEQSSGGAVAPFLAGKNKIINGDFGINQRNFSSTTTSGTFGFDRWRTDNAGGTVTWSAQTFTPGAAPVSGYESTNYLQVITSGQSGTNYAGIYTRLEDGRLFAGQMVTLSFWAKSASGTPSILPTLAQQMGSGGANTPAQQNLTAKPITTSWVRYSWTTTLSSLSGATIGTGSSLQLEINFSDGGGNGTTLGIQNNTFSIWGVQLEAGSIATPFTTATGTLQGELAACQRYYWRWSAGSVNMQFGTALSTSLVYFFIRPPVTPRVNPTSIDYSSLQIYNNNAASNYSGGTWVLSQANPEGIVLSYTHGSGVFTANSGANILNGSSGSAYLGLNQEL